MRDDHDQEAPRMPLWPPDPPPTPPASAPRPSSAPRRESVSRQSAPQAPVDHMPWDDAPPSRVSEAPTQRVNITPQPTPQPAPANPSREVTDAPTQRVSSAPATTRPPVADAATVVTPAATNVPVRTPRHEAPLHIPTRRRDEPSPRARLGVMALVVVLLLAAISGLYAYAASLAAAPKQVMAAYCAAITRQDYRAAYALMSTTARNQQTEAQFQADYTALDTLEGQVKRCGSSATAALTPLSMLSSPRSLIFDATLTRNAAESGQIALTRDAVGWHVAALSTGLQGIDLGPLHVEEAVCTALNQHAYDVAYGLLSTPYQHEQGNAASFARAFGTTLTVSGCAPDLKTYAVNSSDQKATLTSTLTLSIVAASGSGSPSSFSLPAHLTFVREATGWRVDTIDPLLNQ